MDMYTYRMTPVSALTKSYALWAWELVLNTNVVAAGAASSRKLALAACRQAETQARRAATARS